jgi:hypothetical protein
MPIDFSIVSRKYAKGGWQCQLSNRGIEQFFLSYLPAWHFRFWHGSPSMIRQLIFCPAIDGQNGSFFPVHLIRVRIGSPASTQRFDASLF